jgi:hypothetical protein
MRFARRRASLRDRIEKRTGGLPRVTGAQVLAGRARD